MLRLILLRHAKSSWDDGTLDDSQRPLAAKGREAAHAIAGMMVKHGVLPDYVLCSPARRARETWAIVAATLPAVPPMTVDEAIYDFGDGAALLEALRQRGGTVSSLMVVGHNPSIHGLAHRLAGYGHKKQRLRLARKYPTAALAVIRFPGLAWREIAPETGELQYFIRPKDIMPDAGD